MNTFAAIIKNVPDAQIVVADDVLVDWIAPLPRPTDEQIAAWVAAYQPPDPRIAESKAYLLATDYKMLPDYTVAPDGEPLESVRAKRAAARELIRTLT